MKKGIKILTVEDSKEDLVSVQEILSKDFINHSLLNVSGKIDFIKGLNEFKPDIILSNFTSAEFNGFDAIEISKELYPYTPIIIVPGSIDEDTAVECINKGAEDSIIKENIKELGSAIKGALENKILKRERDLEKRIMKLNRTYAVIYRINKMIVNIQDKEILFEEACKIAVESGKFRLAWISLLDEENKVLRPCFWDGLGFEFLEEIKNLSVDDIKCKYPVPAEILKGDFIVYNKIENESGLYFGNNGHKHYFHSLISMPLKLQNKVIGSFNICTDKLESFNNDEINLLNEVTRDISFSLESISNEKALKESEEKFRMITENSADAIFIADKQGKYLYVNNKAVDLLGYSKEEMMTFTLADISPNDRVRDYFQLFNKLLHNQSVFAEIELIKKDGNIILTDLNAVLLPNGFIYASCRDISEKKMVKQRLQESEELFRHSFDYAAVGFCMVGIDKKFQRTNKTFEEIIGYNEDELRNLTFSDITHPEDLDIGLSNFNKMLEEEINSASYEKRYIRKDKRIIWVYISISLVRNADKQPQFFITQIIDITERKRSENLISIFAQSLKSINEIVSITDMDDNLLYVNESYLKTYGYEENELIGRHASTVISPGNPSTLVEEILSATRSGGWKGEVLDIRKDGSEFPIYLSTSIVFDKKGKPFGFMGVALDISERKRFESDLIKAKEVAESVNKLKDAFIANMSHEIRTPLNGILGMTSVLKELFLDKLNKEDEELFEGIDHSSKRIIRTIDMILNYSRLQIGEFNIFKKKISIPAICENLVSEYALSAKIRSLELNFQNNFGNLVLMADEYSINLAISNILDNAIKFTKNGFINLKLNKEKNGEAVLVIEDTGIGIDPEYLAKIFEPYSQAQMGYGRAYEGIGLGLSLVKKVLTLNNAGVSAVSKKGTGSTFSINFGKVENSSEGLIENNIIVNNYSEPARKREIVVLIVEDDKINQLTIRKFLADDYTTIITDSSDEVLELLIKNKVNIILMDISIWGKMNGLELTKVLKASREFSHIPVIAVTAHAFEDDKQNALNAGCDNYLAKPFSKKSLLEMISHLVNNT